MYIIINTNIYTYIKPIYLSIFIFLYISTDNTRLLKNLYIYLRPLTLIPPIPTESPVTSTVVSWMGICTRGICVTIVEVEFAFIYIRA